MFLPNLLGSVWGLFCLIFRLCVVSIMINHIVNIICCHAIHYHYLLEGFFLCLHIYKSYTTISNHMLTGIGYISFILRFIFASSILSFSLLSCCFLSSSFPISMRLLQLSGIVLGISWVALAFFGCLGLPFWPFL